MTKTYIDHKTADVIECVDLTLRALKAAKDLHYALSFPSLEPPTFGYDPIRASTKYIRVWTQQWNINSAGERVEGQRFVCFFVERANGTVWKADGWKRPALNFPRGSVIGVEARADLSAGKMDKSTGYFYEGF